MCALKAIKPLKQLFLFYRSIFKKEQYVVAMPAHADYLDFPWMVRKLIKKNKKEGPNRVCSSLTKVGKFELSGVADEQVLWFQVAVQDVPLVDVGQASQQLEEEELEEETRDDHGSGPMCYS